MKRFIAILSSITILLTFTACTGKIKCENLTESLKPSIGNKETEKVSGNYITDLGADLLSECYEGKNTLISPLSVMCALAMVQNGAEGDTKAQMEKVLGAERATLNNYLLGYCNSLPTGEKYKVNLANSVCIKNDERLSVNQDFLQSAADYYSADVFRGDFDKSTAKDINSWVNENTNEMIPKIVDTIPSETVMYIINALAFEAEWEEIYEDNQVHEDVFFLENGKNEKADFMYCREGVYLEDGNTTGFVKYYNDRKYAFVALLPEKGTQLSDYISELSGKKINSLFENSKECIVNTSIPKFETEYSVELSKTLYDMGMTDAFDLQKADFSSLGTYNDGNGALFISKVVHKTYISVAEKGTKAGAVTSVALDAAGAPAMEEEPKTVYLDRPFVYMLIDCETNTPFFIGALTNP